MNVGVIGGSGFIGSHLVDKLLGAGHEVTVFDIKRPHRPDVPHIHIEITDLPKTAVALTGSYDAVYLLAAVADVNDVHRNPVEASQINIMGVANVLEAARRNNIGRVILASTVWVYGLTAQGDSSEDAPIHLGKADHIYTSQKAAAELLCHSYHTMYGQEFTILRYGIPYGPRARGGTVLATFVQRAFAGQPLTIFGEGKQGRAFVYVEDLAEGNVAALQPVAQGQTYNLEGKRMVSVREVAETVRNIMGNVTIEYKEARASDFTGRLASGDKARQELGWEPRVDFEEGARKYVQWYQEQVLGRKA
ncbi:MAG: NAD-dependent epimerase/dehydratase family protein [Chloroflexi bacterium]|nr:NAD-dependent epimerase/dehydratase family protein [Chloroflexota bacterium]